jgi:putative addiction module CopG family antidote
MQIVLPPELEALVQRQITSGRYQTVLDVLVAGVQLLEHQDKQLAGDDATYGALDADLQFSPLTEAEMTQQSLAVLATYEHDAVPHDQVEAWANSLGTDDEQPCPQ